MNIMKAFEWEIGCGDARGGKERCGCRGQWVLFERGKGRKSRKWKKMCWFLCLVSLNRYTCRRRLID